jgi:hypothetical protein
MARCIGDFKAQSAEVERITHWRWRWGRWRRWLIMLLAFALRSEIHYILEVVVEAVAKLRC